VNSVAQRADPNLPRWRAESRSATMFEHEHYMLWLASAAATRMKLGDIFPIDCDEPIHFTKS
jgi:hypothetical protein